MFRLLSWDISFSAFFRALWFPVIAITFAFWFGLFAQSAHAAPWVIAAVVSAVYLVATIAGLYELLIGRPARNHVMMTLPHTSTPYEYSHTFSYAKSAQSIVLFSYLEQVAWSEYLFWLLLPVSTIVITTLLYWISPFTALTIAFLPILMTLSMLKISMFPLAIDTLQRDLIIHRKFTDQNLISSF